MPERQRQAHLRLNGRKQVGWNYVVPYFQKLLLEEPIFHLTLMGVLPVFTVRGWAMACEQHRTFPA